MTVSEACGILYSVLNWLMQLTIYISMYKDLVKDDYPGLTEEVVVSLFFKSCTVESKRKPRIDAYIPAHNIRERQFNRFIQVFPLNTDTRHNADWQNRFPFGQMRYLIANMNHKQCGQAVVDRKSLKVSLSIRALRSLLLTGDPARPALLNRR
jgi:hypothetical protein